MRSGAVWVVLFMLLLVAETLISMNSVDARAWTLREAPRRSSDDETAVPGKLMLGDPASALGFVVGRLRESLTAGRRHSRCADAGCEPDRAQLGLALQLQSAAAVLNAVTLALCCAILVLAEDAAPLLAASCLGASFFSLLLTVAGLLTWQHQKAQSGAGPPPDADAGPGPAALRLPRAGGGAGPAGGAGAADTAVVALGTLLVLYACAWTLCLLATAPRPEPEPADAEAPTECSVGG